MAKRFTVQKRLRMKTNGYAQVEKQFAWDASEYVGGAKRFTPAQVPAPKKARDLAQDSNGHYRPRKAAHLAGGSAPKCKVTPICAIANWNAESVLIRNGEIIA